MYIIATEEGVKKLSRDYDVYSQRRHIKKEEEKKLETGNINRGTKNLMMKIQDEIKKEEEPIQLDPEPTEPEVDDFPNPEDYDNE